MSRIGRAPVLVPAGVDVAIDEMGHKITVKAPSEHLPGIFTPVLRSG